MDYASFLQTWTEAAERSGLRPIGARPSVTLDLDHLDRRFEQGFEHGAGQHAGPFFVTGALSWRWSALTTARSATQEEDVLVELLGRRGEAARTRKPHLRIDVKLTAKLPYDGHISLPAAATFRRMSEALQPLQAFFPESDGKETRDHNFEVVGWRGAPELDVECGPDGDLRFGGLTIPAFKILELPRQKSDSEARPDKHPRLEVEKLFFRLGSGLEVLTKALDPFLETKRGYH